MLTNENEKYFTEIANFISYLLPLLPVLPRRHTRNFFEKLTERFVIGEVHYIGGVLYGHVGFA